jgi:oxygen-dependent protoporphyrinogen oxidase
VTRTTPTTVAVVGAGIAGLAAAWELVAGSDRAHRASLEVHVLEAGDRVGGKLQSADFAGRRVDLGADAFLARRPEATELCRELGLTGELVPVGASGASVWARGRLRSMPAGLNLGVPTRWWPLFRSGILSPGESLRVARDLVPPHPAARGAAGDRSVGDIVSGRLGRPVVERLVDPLVGGINAGGVDELSAAATFPQLLAASEQPGSLMRRLRPSPTGGPVPGPSSPVFWSLGGGTARLAGALVEALAGRGVTMRTNVSVQSIERQEAGRSGRAEWRLALEGPGAGPDAGRTGGPDRLQADCVVLAVPAVEAAVLLAPLAPAAAGRLEVLTYAPVAVVTLSIPSGAISAPLLGTGFLVPRTSTMGGRPALITACTYLTRKWPHLARPGDELVRASVGRFGDDRHRGLDDAELATSVFGELAQILDIHGAPLDQLVARWDRGLPQYEVGHLEAVERIDREVAGLPGVAVAGAAYRGVGIPACIGSGRAAARRVLASVSGGAPGGGAPAGRGRGG